jgi:cellulose synthase/poly-beta-1,6-N-acetylglucosamine synthase-like glycosyltransferase
MLKDLSQIHSEIGLECIHAGSFSFHLVFFPFYSDLIWGLTMILTLLTNSFGLKSMTICEGEFASKRTFSKNLETFLLFKA